MSKHLPHRYFCGRCGRIEYGAAFCPACGTPMQVIPRTQRDEPSDGWTFDDTEYQYHGSKWWKGEG